MIIYVIDAIDWWYGWTPLERVLQQIVHDLINNHRQEVPETPYSIEHITNRWNQASNLARENGWEGDFRNDEGGPWFCPLPINDSGNSEYLIAWKQDNNGTTFVVSPYPLPWLEDIHTIQIREDAHGE
jgi:hypothetical protein